MSEEEYCSENFAKLMENNLDKNHQNYDNQLNQPSYKEKEKNHTIFTNNNYDNQTPERYEESSYR